jgi:uncharacterized protein YeeX (DUF496 family)
MKKHLELSKLILFVYALASRSHHTLARPLEDLVNKINKLILLLRNLVNLVNLNLRCYKIYKLIGAFKKKRDSLVDLVNLVTKCDEVLRLSGFRCSNVRFSTNSNGLNV